MTRSLRRTRGLLAAMCAVSLVAGACSSDDGDSGGAGSGDSGLTGSILISGSSTVEPISAAVAKLFTAEHPDVVVEVSGPGTGDGFERFCQGETDISDASRAIKASEVDDCSGNGVEFIEVLVGVDGLTVVTDLDNDVECLTFDELYSVLGPESIGFDSWSDGNALHATRFGTAGDLPDEDLTVFAPGEESGTYDFFVEAVVEPVVEALVEDGTIAEGDLAVGLREDYDPQANDNVIKQGIANTPGSLGFFGAAFADDTVKHLAVDAGDGCVAPTAENIGDTTYPISRPLFIYINTAKLADSAALQAYVDLYLSEEGLATVTQVGYVRNAADAEAAEVARVTDGTTGARA